VRGGRIAWPPRPPDLTPLDFYLWGYMKQKVYAVVIESREQLLDRIDIATEEIRQNHAEIQRTTQSVSFIELKLVCNQEGDTLKIIKFIKKKFDLLHYLYHL